jgi:hypothetical protein
MKISGPTAIDAQRAAATSLTSNLIAITLKLRLESDLISDDDEPVKSDGAESVSGDMDVDEEENKDPDADGSKPPPPSRTASNGSSKIRSGEEVERRWRENARQVVFCASDDKDDSQCDCRFIGKRGGVIWANVGVLNFDLFLYHRWPC